VQSSVEEEDSSAETPAKELQKVVGDVGFSVDRYHGYFYMRYCLVGISNPPFKKAVQPPTPWIFFRPKKSEESGEAGELGPWECTGFITDLLGPEPATFEAMVDMGS